MRYLVRFDTLAESGKEYSFDKPLDAGRFGNFAISHLKATRVVRINEEAGNKRVIWTYADGLFDVPHLRQHLPDTTRFIYAGIQGNSLRIA
jgi:hypothetical protein